MHKQIRPTIYVIRRLAALVLALLLLGQAARLVFRADPRDELRHADELFRAGRYYDARAAYAAIVARAPGYAPALVRLGAVYAVRGERVLASQTLASAIGKQPNQSDYDLARLYQGWVVLGQRDQSLSYWSTIGARSIYFPLRRVLEAENLLALADYAGAESSYRAALQPGLPPAWRALVVTRLALLRASSDPVAALRDLGSRDTRKPSDTQAALQFAAPLLPAADPSANQIAEVLRAPSDQRAQLLGQLYLHARLYGLAEAQFAGVAPDSPNALAAAAYAAYTRWSAGDLGEGLRRLQALVAAHPAEPRARALLALAYLTNRDEHEAQAQLDMIRALAPRAPDTHLAWAQLYTAQHDYLAAAEEYRRALGDALPEQRGIYALELARFHLDAGLQLCESGLPAAEEAVRALPDSGRAWSTLAATRFGCRDAAGARAAADQALQHDPASAEALYYLGRALAALGDRPAARQAFVQASDSAPSTSWRERAEAQIATLGL